MVNVLAYGLNGLVLKPDQRKLCCALGHTTSLLQCQVYSWVLMNLMLGVTL